MGEGLLVDSSGFSCQDLDSSNISVLVVVAIDSLVSQRIAKDVVVDNCRGVILLRAFVRTNDTTKAT
jgi:hypothetical protein